MDAFAEFERIFAGHPWLAFLIDREGLIVVANRAANDLFGRTEGRSIVDGCTVETRTPLRDAIGAASTGRASVLTVSTTEGARDLEASVSPWASNLVLLLARDITSEVMRAGQRTALLNRTYRVLSDVNQLLLRTRDEDTLCRAACEIAVSAGGFVMAWLGYADRTCAEVDIKGTAGLAPEDMPLLKKLLSPPEPECVFTCNAIRRGQPQFCNNIATDPSAESWRQAALERGYCSMVALPLQVGEKVIGAFNLYARQPDYFDDEELQLLDRLARDIAFGIDGCRREAGTQDLQDRLRQAQKMEAIGQLAGGVAHDFNNIIAVVRLQADLLKMDRNLPRPVQDGLQQIRIAAERAAELTRQLLLFSRRQVIRPVPLDINHRLIDLGNMLQRMIGETIELRLKLDERTLAVEADPGMFDQLVLNLAINARDAMAHGGRLTITTRERTFESPHSTITGELAPGSYVEIAVADTGIGIAAEVLPHIFEPFYTTKPPGKGTGLGLATVFGIVKQHRGGVTLKTHPGSGTEFTLLLPQTKSRAATVAPPAAPPQGGTESVLVVEDEPSVRWVTRAILERFGYQVIEAGDGVRALAAWQACHDRIALLVTDLVMPGGISGQDLARQLRGERPDLQVIFTSGYSDEMAGRPLELAPGEIFLQKPFPPDQLLRAVRECLDRVAR